MSLRTAAELLGKQEGTCLPSFGPVRYSSIPAKDVVQLKSLARLALLGSPPVWAADGLLLIRAVGTRDPE